MQAMILAAGLGTRLAPLTDHCPKALVEVSGHTLLELAVARLSEAGATRCVVNTHAHSDMMRHYITEHQWPCEVLISDETLQLLDTGGALSHAAHLFSPNEPILVHNVDVLSTIDLRDVERKHREQGNLVTLCVSQRQNKRQLLFDADGRLVSRLEGPTPDGMHALAFSGISIIEPVLFPLLPPDGVVFSAIDCYIQLAQSHRIGSYLHDASQWLDVGTPATLELAKKNAFFSY